MKLKKVLSILLACSMLVSLCATLVTAASPSNVEVMARNDAPVITVDGELSETEWGKPIGSWTKDQIAATSGWAVWEEAPSNSNKTIELYVRRDSQKLYLAFRMTHALRREKGATTDLTSGTWKFASTIFNIGVFNKDTNIVNATNSSGTFEKYFKYVLRERYDVANDAFIPNATASGKGIAAKPLSSYAIGWEDATNTYTYEVAIPFSDFGGYITATSDLALSFEMTDAKADDKASGSRWFISQACYQANDRGVTTAFRDYNPIHVTFSDCYVTSMAGPMTGAPTIDGSVSEAEWNDPMIVTSPDHAKTVWGNNGFNNAEPTKTDKDQRVKAYVTNDNDAIYLAVTVDHSGQSNFPTSILRSPQITVSVSRWDEETTVPHIKSGNDEYEQFSAFRVGWRDGNLQLLNYPSQMDKNKAKLGDDDWKVIYDANAKTYTYELRIPFSATNIDLSQTQDIALSIHVGDSNYGTATSGYNNRYNIGGTGAVNCESAKNAGNFPHKNQAMKVTLNEKMVTGLEGTYANYTVGKVGQMAVDATISTGEWGEPMIVTSPVHAPTEWGNNGFNNAEPTKTDKNQRVKVYATNDNDAIYLAVTVDHSGQSTFPTSILRSPQITVSVSRWDAETTVPHVKSGNNEYEQFSAFRIGWQGGVLKALNYPSQMDKNKAKLGDNDWKVIYDADAKTYTYELRIPFSATNVDLTQTQDIALSIHVGDSNYGTGNGEYNNRYNIGGTGAVNNESAKNAGSFPHKNQAMKVTLNPWETKVPDAYVKNRVEKKQGDIVMDASISDGEWGEPIIVTSPDHVVERWGNNGYWNSEPTKMNKDQRVKVYATNDSEYIYLAATLDHAGDSIFPASLNRSPQMTVSLAQWDDTNTVPHVVVDNQEYEQFSCFRIGWQGGVLKVLPYNSQMDKSKVKLTEDDWEAVYNADTDTYTYEVRIPFSATNISLTQSEYIALSVHVGDSNYGTSSSEYNNRYNIGGTGAANQESAKNAGTYPHKNQALKIALQQQYYVDDHASYAGDTLTMDGKITVKEWGNPVIVTNPEHTKNTWNGFETAEASVVDNNQTARVWLTNDDNYLYVGATLDRSAAQVANSNEATKQAHFLFDVAADDGEQFAGFVMWLDDQGKAKISCRSKGLDAWTPAEEDYAIVYDAQAQTYTYEIRIPYSATNIDVTRSRNMVLCGSLGMSFAGQGTQSNVYHFQTGHIASGETPHKDAMIPFILNPISVVKDTVAPFLGNISIDGSVSAAEWGNPVIVTYPAHCKEKWVFWENDPNALKPEQMVKVYATNDDENLYLACVIDQTKFDDSDGYAYAKAHFFFSIGRYDEETGMERIRSEKKIYERFNMYHLFFNNDNQVQLNATGNKVANVKKDDCDYVISYNEEAQTYTYEVRIPLSQTTLRFGNKDEMAIGFAISPARVESTAANRYNIGGTGTAFGNNKADNFAHTGQCMKLKLNPNAYSETPVTEYNPTVSSNPVTADAPLVIWVTLVFLSTLSLVIFSALRRKYNK